jgi:hypothetical protein
MLSFNGCFGLLATNTIAQGDTREVSLDQLATDGCVIHRAVPSCKWPGTANLEVAHVWMCSGFWAGKYVLNEKPVSGITPFLTVPGKATGTPYRLAANQDKSFIGSYVLGMGFILTLEEAQDLIAKDPRNKDVLFPYLNGEDLNSRPDQSPSRWVINFFDWPLDAEHDEQKNPKGPPYAADYPDCLAIVEEKVKPERTRLNDKCEFVLRKPLPQKWWIYAEKRPALYTAIAGMERFLIRARVSNINSIAFVSTGTIISEATVVFASDDFASFANLQAMAHTEWLNHHSSSMRTDVRYTPSDCFEPFPFPLSTSNLNSIGEKYYTHRQFIMQTRQEGLTKTYNRFHNSNESATDIQQLRELHVEMDYAVAAAYDWQDLDLGHDFHETKQGLRYTISEIARQEVLDRLLELNHGRYEDEVRMGLHDKGKKKSKAGSSKKGKVKVSPGQTSLL